MRQPFFTTTKTRVTPYIQQSVGWFSNSVNANDQQSTVSLRVRATEHGGSTQSGVGGCDTSRINKARRSRPTAVPSNIWTRNNGVTLGSNIALRPSVLVCCTHSPVSGGEDKCKTIIGLHLVRFLRETETGGGRGNNETRRTNSHITRKLSLLGPTDRTTPPLLATRTNTHKDAQTAKPPVRTHKSVSRNIPYRKRRRASHRR